MLNEPLKTLFFVVFGGFTFCPEATIASKPQTARNLQQNKIIIIII